MKPAIESQNIGKLYKIGGKKERYLSLRDSLASLFSWRTNKKENFWALKNVDFKIMPGESVGIIGNNGAGKSTLLKILSQITPPTQGKAILRGKLACLLEVGTGFHPELTGRENIFLNGSLLGIKKVEVKNQFDAIVDFSGVEQFLETPLKHFSYGMQMRLGFAVAAHLETEVLLLDEMLAVGDADFQKKCLQKMSEVVQSGKTILFISHNMAEIRQLCGRGMVLEKGKLTFSGLIGAAIDHHLCKSKTISAAIWENHIDDSPRARLERIVISDAIGCPKTEFISSEEVHIHFHTIANETINRFTIGFDLFKNGIHIVRSRQVDSLLKATVTKGERNIFTCRLPAWFLHRGTYAIRPFMAIHLVEHLSKVNDRVELNIEVKLDTSRSPLHSNLPEQDQPGLIFPMFDWKYL